MDSLPVLVRDGIRLREVDPTDAAALTALFKKPEVSAYLDPPPGTRSPNPSIGIRLRQRASWLAGTVGQGRDGETQLDSATAPASPKSTHSPSRA